MIADVQHSTGDVTLGLVIVGGLLVFLAAWARPGLGMLLQIVCGGGTYLFGTRRIEDVQPQQAMGMVFLGLVLGLLLCLVLPGKTVAEWEREAQNQDGNR